MTRFISRLALIATLILFAACEKNGSDEISKKTMSLLPKGADAVFGVHLADLTKSALWKEYIAPQIASDDDYKEMVAACGKDPLAEITSIVGAVDADADLIALVIKGVSHAEAEACGKGSDDPFTLSKDGKLTVITNDKGEKAYVQWLDDETVFFTGYMDGPKKGDEAAQKQAVLDALGAKEGVADNAEMMKLLDGVDTSDTLYFATNAAGVPDNPMPGKWKTAVGSVDIGDGMELNVKAGFASAETATQLAAKAKALIGMAVMKPELAWIPEKVKISADGSSVVGSIKLSKEDFAKIEKLAEGGALPIPGARAKGPDPEPASDIDAIVEQAVKDACACKVRKCALEAMSGLAVEKIKAKESPEAVAKIEAGMQRAASCLTRIERMSDAMPPAAQAP